MLDIPYEILINLIKCIQSSFLLIQGFSFFWIDTVQTSIIAMSIELYNIPNDVCSLSIGEDLHGSNEYLSYIAPVHKVKDGTFTWFRRMKSL